MDLDAALTLLARDADASLDLAEVALELARDEYPNLDVEAHLGELAGMAHEARRYVRGDFPARVDGLRRYLFHEMGFRGNVRDYYNPRNSYLHLVLEHRTGIPITLAAVFMAVGRRTGLMVQGVGLPGHFIAKVVEGAAEIYVDCFHGGRLLTTWDCENLVRQVTGMPFQASAIAMRATPLANIFQRMLGNLRSIYLQAEDYPRAARVLGRMFQLDPYDAGLRRDLGLCLVRLGQIENAADHLRQYLEVAADASDAPAIQGLLRRIERGLL